MEEQEQFSTQQIVVIGSSAGGIEALATLVSTLPPDFAAPVVIAQHLDPRRASHLNEILTKSSTLPVQTVNDRRPLKPGVVYVVPSNNYVEIVGPEVQVRRDDERPPLPSIDLLFMTAASSFGENTFAVVLTGTGVDGAAGARDVKAAGGTVIIQNPETASFPDMPLALAPSIIDIVANLEAIGPLLGDLLSGSYPLQAPEEDQQLRTLLDQLRDRSGIDFAAYKAPTIMRRLQRRMAATGTTNLNDYVHYLQRNPDEHQRLISSFLIKVTEFFRDPDLFDYLLEHVLPAVTAEARERGELRIWSAGCATGEEAYSLAILVTELLGDDFDGVTVRIFATDLDADAVAFARRGIYPATALQTITPEMMERYFIPTDGAYEVRKRVRSIVVFGQHDLGQRAPFPRIDLILCRNVLIYFTQDLQKRALQLFAFSLRDGGYLALGKAETVGPLPEFFALEQPRLKIYRRVGDRVVIPTARIRESAPFVPFRLSTMRPSGQNLAIHRAQRQQEGQAGSERADSLLLRLPVGVVVVDRKYDIQMINSTARRLLGIHGVAIGEDLIHQIQHAPMLPLRKAIDAAFRGETTTVSFSVDGGDTVTGNDLDLELRCFAESSEGTHETAEMVTIIVDDVTRFAAERREHDGHSKGLQQEIQRAQSQLQRLSDANQILVEANEELTTNNAELRNTNEELLVANEEVQSATEEVETLNEELQATNEELETLNEELQATVEELNTTNDDLQARSLELQDLTISLEVQRRESEVQRERIEAILENMGDAVLVVDENGQPIVTNAAFRQMFGETGQDFLPEDVSGHLLQGLDTLEYRVSHGESFMTDFMITANDGNRRWFEVTGHPLAGASGERREVLVIRDITERSLRRLQDEFLALASHELRSPLTSLTGNLQMLKRRLGPDADERAARYIEMAQTQTRHLAALAGDLVDVVRLRTGRFNLNVESTDLGAVIGEIVEAGQHMAGEKDIQLDLPAESVVAPVDQMRLEQVLMNLLVNAVTHAPDSKRIDIRLRRDEDMAEIQCQDYGPGIPAAEIERIFARFTQIETMQSPRGLGGNSGLGLGLFIAREIVNAHGGTITVNSREGEGTIFIVRLPLERQASSS